MEHNKKRRLDGDNIVNTDLENINHNINSIGNILINIMNVLGKLENRVMEIEKKVHYQIDCQKNSMDCTYIS